MPFFSQLDFFSSPASPPIQIIYLILEERDNALYLFLLFRVPLSSNVARGAFGAHCILDMSVRNSA